MAGALRTAYDAMPEPRLVAALGDCALGCNILGDPTELAGPLDTVLPVDIRIPGCPPTPDAIAQHLLAHLDPAAPLMPSIPDILGAARRLDSGQAVAPSGSWPIWPSRVITSTISHSSSILPSSPWRLTVRPVNSTSWPVTCRPRIVKREST